MSNLFNKTIDGRQFNFQPIDFGHESVYHVDVKDEEGTRWEFRMTHDEGSAYKLEGEKLPPWILKLKPEIEAAIGEHE